MAGKSNMELLTRDENRIQPFLTPYWNPLACGLIAAFGAMGARAMQKRPMWSGIQFHITAVGLATLAGYYLDRYRDSYLAERDAVLRHYLQLHPEDFPEPERKKYSEVFQKWVPIR